MTASGLTWKELKELGLSGIEAAADGWRDASSRANAARSRVDNEMTAKLRETPRAVTAGWRVGRPAATCVPVRSGK